MRFAYAARPAAAKLRRRACVHAVMDGWIDGACCRHFACMHACRRRRSGRPAVGVRPGRRARPLLDSLLSTPPTTTHHSFIHRRPRPVGRPASAQPLRTHVAAGPRPLSSCMLRLWSAACRYGTGSPGRGHAWSGAGQPATMLWTPRARHANTAARARATCAVGHCSCVCMPCLVTRSQGAGSPIFGTGGRTHAPPSLHWIWT